MDCGDERQMKSEDSLFFSGICFGGRRVEEKCGIDILVCRSVRIFGTGIFSLV